MIELLSPAGTYDKLVTAFTYGADAVYFAGKKFGLRAFAGNFDNDEIFKATEYAHSLNKKVYVTINLIARDSDFEGLEEYLKLLEKAKVDGVIVADIGVAVFVKQHSNLELHISTQANILNSYSANFFAQLGAKRLVLARELSFEEIKKIRQSLPPEIDLEVFVHGAMCISYSGRCLLSNYLTGRDSNRGACVQACRWEYMVSRKPKDDEKFEVQEDEKGTYIFNSKDLNLIEHIGKLIEIGIKSFKIEGRMKTQYYVANVTNAYRRAIDDYLSCQDKTNWKCPEYLKQELYKSSHREYTTGFTFEDPNGKENIKSSLTVQTYKIVAHVLEDQKDGVATIQQQNRFKKGDVLEVLSFGDNFLKQIKVEKMLDEQGNEVEDAKFVEQKLQFLTNLPLKKGEILRMKEE